MIIKIYWTVGKSGLKVNTFTEPTLSLKVSGLTIHLVIIPVRINARLLPVIIARVCVRKGVDEENEALDYICREISSKGRFPLSHRVRGGIRVFLSP